MGKGLEAQLKSAYISTLLDPAIVVTDLGKAAWCGTIYMKLHKMAP